MAYPVEVAERVKAQLGDRFGRSLFGNIEALLDRIADLEAENARVTDALNYALAMLDAALAAVDVDEPITDIGLVFGIRRVKDLRDGITVEDRKLQLYTALHGEETAKKLIAHENEQA